MHASSADILFLAAPADRRALAPIAEHLAMLGHAAAGLQDDEVGSGTDAIDGARRLVLIWSRQADEAGILRDGLPSVMRAWAEDRLLVARLDDHELPTGLRDLDTTRLDPERPLLSDLVHRLTGRMPEPDVVPSPSPPDAPEAPMPMGAPRTSRARKPGLLIAFALVGCALPLGVGAWLLLASTRSHEPPSMSAEAERKTPSRPPAPETAPPAPSGSSPAPAPPPRTAPPPVGSAPPPPVGSAPPAPGGAVRPSPTPPLPDATPWTYALSALAVGLAAGIGIAILVLMLLRRRKEAVVAPLSPVLSEGAAPSRSDEAPGPDAAPQIFVSYSRKNAEAVDGLVSEITRLGYSVWIDRHAGGSGRYAAKIVSGIKASSVVALMCSREAFQSDHVTREVYVAGDWRKPFIAIQLDGSDIPDELLYFLSGFPRIQAVAVDPQDLRVEIDRLIAA